MIKLNSFKISNISENGKLTIGNLFHKQTPIRAGNEILKIHHLFLNNLNCLGKTKHHKHNSPFALFSQSLALVNQLRITLPTPSELADKISQIGQKQNLDSPLQNFIRSLSLHDKNTELTASNKIGAPTAGATYQFSAEIVDVVKENKDFKTLRLKRPKDWDFQPGQYLEIRGENSSATKPAILAIASAIDDEYIEITAKPNDNPNHSNYCLNSQIGDYLTITGPLGSNFPLDLVTSETPVLILGGGSGLTALKSIMNSLPENSDAKMIYSSKTYEGLLYHEEIEKWKSEGHIISLTQDHREGFHEGRITEHLQYQQLKPNTLVFICGPKELVLQTAQELVEMGVPRECIYGSLPATAKEGGPVYRGDHPKMMV